MPRLPGRVPAVPETTLEIPGTVPGTPDVPAGARGFILPPPGVARLPPGVSSCHRGDAFPGLLACLPVAGRAPLPFIAMVAYKYKV